MLYTPNRVKWHDACRIGLKAILTPPFLKAMVACVYSRTDIYHSLIYDIAHLYVWWELCLQVTLLLGTSPLPFLLSICPHDITKRSWQAPIRVDFNSLLRDCHCSFGETPTDEPGLSCQAATGFPCSCNEPTDTCMKQTKSFCEQFLLEKEHTCIYTTRAIQCLAAKIWASIFFFFWLLKQYTLKAESFGHICMKQVSIGKDILQGMTGGLWGRDHPPKAWTNSITKQLVYLW